VFTFVSPVTFNVPATKVLPVAPATVNLSVLIRISDVAEPTKLSPAASITQPVVTGLPATDKEPVIVTSQPTARSSPTIRSSLSVKSSPSIT
jgi:hypothetical protein